MRRPARRDAAELRGAVLHPSGGAAGRRRRGRGRPHAGRRGADAADVRRPGPGGGRPVHLPRPLPEARFPHGAAGHGGRVPGLPGGAGGPGRRRGGAGGAPRGQAPGPGAHLRCLSGVRVRGSR